jgi:hypothetical protein
VNGVLTLRLPGARLPRLVHAIAVVTGILPSGRAGLRFSFQFVTAPAATAVRGAAVLAAYWLALRASIHEAVRAAYLRQPREAR